MTGAGRSTHRWGVILAGGDGKRLLSLTRKLTGDDRPKQFCALTANETLLDQTRQRVSRVVPKEQTVFVLTRTHERFYTSQLADMDPLRQLVQPANHGTAPAIAYSLTRLRQMDPDATVAFFPSDHHFGDPAGFSECIDQAFRQAESNAARVILLGIAPEAPEESYGWIEPGRSLGHSVNDGIFEVNRFWEKPTRRIASQLMRRGCVWNSFVMVGRVSAFLDLIRKTLPGLLARLDEMWETVAPGEEALALQYLYSTIPASNFSDKVLAAKPSALAVLRADALGWSDLGEPQRVFSVTGFRQGAVSPAHAWIQVPA